MPILEYFPDIFSVDNTINESTFSLMLADGGLSTMKFKHLRTFSYYIN